MRLALRFLLAFALASIAVPVRAGVTDVLIERTALVTQINNVALTAAAASRWTGWIDVHVWRSVTFEVTYTYAAATAVTMRCETSDSSATVADAGFDLKIGADTATAGRRKFTTLTLANEDAATGKWSWTIAMLPHNYVNCLFVGEGSPTSGDLITVKIKGMFP